MTVFLTLTGITTVLCFNVAYLVKTRLQKVRVTTAVTTVSGGTATSSTSGNNSLVTPKGVLQQRKVMEFSLNKTDFHWIQRIQRNWQITEAWIRANFRILSVTCVFVALLSVSYIKGGRFDNGNHFYSWNKIVTEFAEKLKWFVQTEACRGQLEYINTTSLINKLSGDFKQFVLTHLPQFNQNFLIGCVTPLGYTNNHILLPLHSNTFTKWER